MIFLRNILTTMMMVLALAAATVSHAVEVKKEPGKKIDMSMTLSFIQTWSARDKWDKFPESPSFAYYNIYSLKALHAEISPDLRKKVIDALRSCQMKDGGFSAGPGYGTDSNVIFTYYSLATLDLLNALDAINREPAAAYIVSLWANNGAIRAKAADQSASLASTYYGVASLALLNKLDAVDRKKVAAYIGTYREERKGYCVIPGKISMPGSTFTAVKSLSLLGALTPDIRNGVVNYLKESRYSGLVKNKKYTSLPNIEDMTAVLQTLAELSALNSIDRHAVYRFLESLYIAENGGFGPEPGLGTTPPSTYYAIVCLEKLGKLGKKASVK